jgi:outer membrane immunogenic protein
MRALKLAGLTTAMVLPFAAGALAADAVMAPPLPPAAPQIQPAPVQFWTGPYAGVFLGYNWGDFEAIPAEDADAVSGGGYAGYNWESNDFVFGVEADAGYSGQEASGAGRQAEVGLFGSLRGRAGYSFNPFMVYATGGVAAADIEYTEAGVSDSNTQLGYTVGGGVEGFVTDNVTARVEYRYTDYGSDDYNLGAGTISSGYDEHSDRAGVGLKF